MTHGLSDYQINPAAARTPQAEIILDLQEHIRFLEAYKRMTILDLQEQVKKLQQERRILLSASVIAAKKSVAQQTIIAAQAAQIAALREVLRRAEQTMRNLSNGFLTGDGKEIAANEASNMREALKASAA
jgi:hypothetical protein